MSSTLVKQNLLDSGDIDYHQLTLSLINSGISSGNLNPNWIENFQAELMSLLSHTILQYTHEESNSVKTEIAQSILQSIMYCIDLSLLDAPKLDHAFEELLKNPVSKLHEKGLAVYKGRINLAKDLLTHVKATMIPTPIIAYNDTILSGFEDYFKNPDGLFEAHSAGPVIDYPLLFDDPSWTGILYAERYLQCLLLENQFCALYSIQSINQLITGCAKKFKMVPGDLMNNIPELILRNSICSILLGFSGKNLAIENANCSLLESKLRLLSDKEIEALLHSGLQALFMELVIQKSPLSSYLRSFPALFLPHLIHGVRSGSLRDTIILNNNPQKLSQDFYISGLKLPDEELRKVISEISECENGERKADLIQAEVKSMEDLVEVFDSYCIFDEEYSSIFNRMTNYELALLAKDLVDGSPFSEEISLRVEDFQSSENRIYWQRTLARYLSCGEAKRLKEIILLAKELTTP